ncbi:MAG: PD-(D/E)XK nuclease family protein [Xanthomonadales bacterium]|nr:PD-(D/E)XK nuclease family protein [Xanthomonadales bacterium]
MTNSGSEISTQIPGLSTQSLEYESLFLRLKAGHTLITGNSRLSRVLTGQYSQWRISQGDQQWQSPAISSWSEWQDKLWEAASLQGMSGTDRAVPGKRQLISLWESTLKETRLAHQLLRPESLANQLKETRSLIADWQLDLKDSCWFGGENENHAAFYHWNRAFEKRCEKGRWISPQDRLIPLCKALAEGLVPPSESVDLLGFDEFSPAQANLLSALIANGNPVCRLTIASRQDKAFLWKYRDSKQEYQQMARWVRHWFETEPESTIAIVVPDLHAKRQLVERYLEEILSPGYKNSDPQAKPWNFSMGVPLIRVPLIETAFDLLKLLDKRIDIQTIGRVLRSPWLRGALNERNQRALLEKCLRDQYPRQLKLGELIYRSSEIKKYDHQDEELPPGEQTPQNWNSPELTGILETLQEFENDNRRKQPASSWAKSFNRLLMNLGWPLSEELLQQNAEEYGNIWQARKAWHDGLRELASLDATVSGLERNVAINQLKQICREEIFQPHTPSTPIQVLGHYEVSGLRFDHLWVLGLHNGNWPGSAKPNPFIPGKLQREAALPNSSPKRELEVARTITQRLLETAPDCVFSYPGQLDGEDVLPSPLLELDTINTHSEPPSWQGDDWRSIVASATEPQIGPLEKPGQLIHPPARGGSSILKNQALCPFRAFASNRLGADGLETPVDGISPVLHGDLVHRVLEKFWKETRTQAALLQLDDETLSERLRGYVDFESNENRGLKQRPAFRVVEADRVQRHIVDFLALEKEREPFEVVGFEKEIHTEINGQTIRLFIDRIDRVAAGDEIIIDYKTGREDPKKWFGDRPDNPQLPLYAISAENDPVGVVFGIIRDDGCVYKGVVKRGGLLPGLPPKETSATRYLVEAGNELPETIENWRQVLHHLMKDFIAGETAIDPKDGLNTCNNSYCKLQSLCRVGELEQLRKTNIQNTLKEPSA